MSDIFIHLIEQCIYVCICVQRVSATDRQTDGTYTHTYTQEQGVLTLSGTLKYLKTDLIV